MKKLFAIVALLCITAVPGFSAEKYGVVNIEAVMAANPEAKAANDWLRTEELKIQKFVIDARKDIDKTADSAKQAKEDKYNKQLQQMAQSLKTQEAQKAQKLYNDFNIAVQKVARQQGYTLIVPAALFGAQDITQEVIKAMKK
ncbi:MAG: OmpH family outer membrane protein [Candidatus Gastranaerophilaceae bacterium]